MYIDPGYRDQGIQFIAGGWVRGCRVSFRDFGFWITGSQRRLDTLGLRILIPRFQVRDYGVSRASQHFGATESHSGVLGSGLQ